MEKFNQNEKGAAQERLTKVEAELREAYSHKIFEDENAMIEWAKRYEGEYAQALNDADAMTAGMSYMSDTSLAYMYIPILRALTQDKLGRFNNPSFKD